MSPETVQGWLNVGLGGALLAALFLGFKRVWVWGWMYAEAIKERDEWKTIALRGLMVTDTAVKVAEKATTTDTDA